MAPAKAPSVKRPNPHWTGPRPNSIISLLLDGTMTAVPPPYRISGHESFPCRYTWLPKAVRGLEDNPRLFSDEDQAMVDLGLGKNMVRSARFWAQAAGMIAPVSRSAGHKPTDLILLKNPPFLKMSEDA